MYIMQEKSNQEKKDVQYLQNKSGSSGQKSWTWQKARSDAQDIWSEMLLKIQLEVLHTGK